MFRRGAWALTCVCALVLLSGARPATSRPAPPHAAITRGEVAEAQLLLTFDPATSERERDALVASQHGRTLRYFRASDARLVSVAAGVSMLGQAAAYSVDPRIRFTEPNFRVHAAAVPNDPDFAAGYQWALRNTGQTIDGLQGLPGADISAPAAWDITTGDRSVVIGVIDSGIAYDHPDLAANVWQAPLDWSPRGCGAGTRGYDTIAGDCDPRDEFGQGTAIAGVIGALGNNGAGVAGVNWTTSLFALKALDGRGSGTIASVVDAIDVASEARQAGINIRVLHNSWLSGDASRLLRDAIQRAGDQGILVVTPAGSNGYDLDRVPLYPASYDLPNVLVVTAVNNRDDRVANANYGARTVHVAAPGVGIYTTNCVPDTTSSGCSNGYGEAAGTPFAAAFASGVAALALSAPSGDALTPGQLIARLAGCGDRVGALATFTASGRRLNAARAAGGCATVTVLPRVGGTVSLAPPGNDYAYGDRVAVSVAPDEGAIFSEWLVNGVAAGAANPLTLTVDQAFTVQARFTFRLAANSSSGGTIRLDPDAIGYAPGATVTATAMPSPGFRFAGWRLDGADAGVTSPRTVYMDQPHTLYASFAPLPTATATATTTPPVTPVPPPGPGTSPPTPTPGRIMPGIGKWSAWQPQGGVLTDAPAATTFAGRTYVFARGLDNALYVKSSRDAVYWTEWQWLGGVLSAAPAAASTTAALYILARGQDDALYVMTSQDGVTFSAWHRAGGVLAAPPAAARFDSTLLIFAIGADAALYVMSTPDGATFSEWSRLGGTLTSGPAATSFLGRVHAFVKGSDNALYETVTSDGVNFSAWRSQGGVLTAAPAAAAATPIGGQETLYVLVRGSDGALYERHSQDGASYTSWRGLGGRHIGAPAAAGDVRLVAFTRWIDNTLYERHTPP